MEKFKHYHLTRLKGVGIDEDSSCKDVEILPLSQAMSKSEQTLFCIPVKAARH